MATATCGGYACQPPPPGRSRQAGALYGQPRLRKTPSSGKIAGRCTGTRRSRGRVPRRAAAACPRASGRRRSRARRPRPRARSVSSGRLGLADDEPVEGGARVAEVVRAHRDVVPLGGDHRRRMQAPHVLRDGHGGRVLQRRPARDDDEVGRPAASSSSARARNAARGAVVAGVAALDLEVEHVDGEARAAQLGRQADQLRLDARPVGPAAAVQRAGEHQQDARLRRSARRAASVNRGSRAGAASRGTP